MEEQARGLLQSSMGAVSRFKVHVRLASQDMNFVQPGYRVHLWPGHVSATNDYIDLKMPIGREDQVAGQA
ncbi:hypothetical protein AAE478_003329 [Parahypoxylon ruwenzoriense]